MKGYAATREAQIRWQNRDEPGVASPGRSAGRPGLSAPGASEPRISSRSLGYLPALDGVRAVAVLAVMLFHFGQGWLPGGYMGVDVFFVLSGFLITTLLIQNAPRPFRARGLLGTPGTPPAPCTRADAGGGLLVRLHQPPLEQAAVRGQGIATIAYINNWWLLRTDRSTSTPSSTVTTAAHLDPQCRGAMVRWLCL